DALEWMVTSGLGYFPETWQALDLIQKDYIAEKRLGPVCLHARIYRNEYAGTERLLRRALGKNPDRNVQGIACFTLAGVLRDYAQFAEALKEPTKAKRLEQAFPRDLVQKLKASNPEKLRKEAEDLYQHTLEKYRDVQLYAGSSRLRERVEATLYEVHYLQIGK